MLIDSHAHLTHEQFNEDLGTLLKRAQESGVEAIINICTNPQEVEKGLELSKAYPWIYTACSTTPHDVKEEGEKYFATMQKYAEASVLVAIGETGLDYHSYADTKEIQKIFFSRYLELAKHLKLPVIIHCRDAFEDLFTILDREYPNLPAVLHCFTGTMAEAKQVIERGLYLSLSGIVTFKKSIELQEIAKMIPLEQLLIETDAPYLAPAPHRGKRNEPAYLLETAKSIASLRGQSLDSLAAATTSNARTFFNI